MPRKAAGPAREGPLWDVSKCLADLVLQHATARALCPRKAESTYRDIYDTAHYAGFVAGSGEHGYNTNVRSLLKRIRKKFAAINEGFAEIENVQRVGYRWRDRPSDEPM